MLLKLSSTIIILSFILFQILLPTGYAQTSTSYNYKGFPYFTKMIFGPRENIQFMATSTSYSSPVPIIISKRTAQNYTQISNIYCPYNTNEEAIISDMIFNRNATRLLVIYGRNIIPHLKTYQLSQSKLQYTIVQDLYLLTSTSINQIYTINCLSSNDQFLLISTWKTSTIFKLDSFGIYNQITFFSSAVNMNRKARILTPDGLFYLQDINQVNTTCLNVYGYDGATFTLLGIFDIGFLTSNIKLILISESGIPLKYRVIITSSIVVYYELITVLSPLSFSFTLIQTIRAISNSYQGYLTFNGYYLQVSTTILSRQQLFFLKYNSSTNQYDDYFSFNNKLPNYAQSMFINEEGSFAMMMISSFQGYAAGPNWGYYLFICNISYCANCSWQDVCQICNSGFVLNNNTCNCPIGQSLVNSTCINCSIDHCNICNATMTCSGCDIGYTLVSNACICSFGNTISLLTGQCVPCSVLNCYRCDSNNTCSVFNPSPSLSGSESKYDQIYSMMILVIVVIVVIVVAVIFGLVYFYKKVSYLSQKETRIQNSNKKVSVQHEDKKDQSLFSSQIDNIKAQNSEAKISYDQNVIQVKSISEEVYEIGQTKRKRRRKQKTQKTELNFDKDLEQIMDLQLQLQ